MSFLSCILFALITTGTYALSLNHARRRHESLAASTIDSEIWTVEKCVTRYADNLDEIKPGLGDYIRAHPLNATSISERSVVIGGGSGNTGTHSIYLALKTLKMNTWHAAKNVTWDSRRGDIRGILKKGHKSKRKRGQCHKRLRKFDYVKFLESADAVVDMPTAEVFLNLFLAFPNAKVILSTRPPENWVEGRQRFHGHVPPPMQEPCGLTLKDFSSSEIALLYSMNNELVRCLVPRDQLLEFDFWTDSAKRMKGLMKELGAFVGRSAPEAPLPEWRDNRAIKSEDVAINENTKPPCERALAETQSRVLKSPNSYFSDLRKLVHKDCNVDLGFDHIKAKMR